MPHSNSLLIAPLLLSMYFVTMEVAQGIEANKKVGRVGSMVADLVTQQKEITLLQLEAILSIGEATLQPYNRSKPTIIITAIKVTDETTPKVNVVWSRKLVDGTVSIDAVAGTVTTVPAVAEDQGEFSDPGREQAGLQTGDHMGIGKQGAAWPDRRL